LARFPKSKSIDYASYNFTGPAFKLQRERFPMSDEHDDYPNDPIDDEMDEAVMTAAELVARVKRIGTAKLELPISDGSNEWIVTVKKRGNDTGQAFTSDGFRDHDGSHDGTRL
jgi:hypothetical protein